MPVDEKRMTFTEHLAELRTRIIRSGICLFICMIICYALSNYILQILARPLMPLAEKGIIQTSSEPNSPVENNSQTPNPNTEAQTEPSKKTVKPVWTVLNPLEIVFVQLKTAAYIGFVLAFPFIAWQVCAFIFPGLRESERRVVKVLIFGCSGLAIVGVAVAYFGVLPLVLPYMMLWVPEGWQIQLRANETISMILLFLAGFAVAFQFPMAVMILVFMGFLSPAVLKKQRKFAFVIIAVIAAVLTPPDPGSMMIMMLPLVAMYEISIWLSYLVIRRKKQAAAASQA
ncbi:MAG TPA: twin-arginine translocase subunit TatC [Candidatus Hydrogenedentes bacterium]|nr:twin-arginine translocase subunit TatC [Candidatus Hydrogenedentota bacterium]